MILTVTPDPVLDKIFFIEQWTPGLPMRAEKTTVSVGGKGLDASVALRHLNIETIGLCFLAGKTGQELFDRIMDYGIRIEPVWVNGETRTAYIVAERKHQRHSHLFSGQLTISHNHLENFLMHLQEHLQTARWLISGGIFSPSLPDDLFATFVDYAHQAGVPVLLDTHSQYLREALAAQPEIIKMNWKEFEWSFGVSAITLDELIEIASEIRIHQSLNALVITCGVQGLLAFTAEGILHAKPPTQKVVNAAGAGDAASAVLAWQFSLEQSWFEALRLAAAASAAVVLTEGTADLHLDDVQRILPQVIIRRL